MTEEIKDIIENNEIMLQEIEDQDFLESAKEEYAPFEENMKSLLECDCFDTYFTKYDAMCKEGNAVIECFEIDDAEELKEYVEEEELSLDELKVATAQATSEALEMIIYDMDEGYN